MCFPYGVPMMVPVTVPNTTTYYGPEKDGKQTISVYEGNSRKTYIADKKQADKYCKHETNYQNNFAKSGMGFCTALMSGCLIVLKNKWKYCKPLGIAGVAIGALYGLCKLISSSNDKKQALNVLNEIKQSQNV